ncbi:MAG: hypothetical protein KJO11_04725, partial [Gemmatimonadetes bacterium]|nr:hypothetical protein [Gemmatimonadota bacterium]
LDELASGTLGAPETWERWRDLIRDLHEEARERKQSGGSTLQQQDVLRRLLANAPEPRPVEPDEVESLSWAEAQDLAGSLREAGVAPSPTERQLEYIGRLLEDLDLDEATLAEVVGPEGPEGLRTTTAASEVIDALQAIYDERRPPSAKQRRYVDNLIEKLGLAEDAAAALVGVESLEELTGGREGSASALIDQLSERLETAG